ncbi:MAG TPA: pyridine nucleotide-disulfide oxidoreductase, partial [Gammaproteobacteria bacterium]|nr:pyridine nucleotide-disulfide oxidoreductase [Gammaproteobacteria bacterium]
MDDRHDNEEQSLTLGIAGFRYEDLSRPEGLKRLHDTFVAELAETFAGLHREYQDYRSCLGAGMTPVAVSDLLVRLAPRVGEFVARLFDVSAERERQREAIQRELDTVFVFRKEIVGELAKHFKGVDARAWDLGTVQAELELLIRCGFPDLSDDPDQERRIAATAARLWRWASAAGDDEANLPQAAVRELRDRLSANGQAAEVFAAAIKLTDDELVTALLEVIRRWSHLAQVDPEQAKTVANWVSFKEPEKTHFDALVPHEIETREGYAVWKG